MKTQGNRRWAAVLVAVMMVMLAGGKVASAQENFRVIISFDGTDGTGPNTSLAQSLDGNLYGTTSGGGGYGFGTVFKMTPTGTLATLYSFCAEPNCADGRSPLAGVVQDADGNFYGTTEWGGVDNDTICANGCGTVFKITPGGTLSTLYSFCAQANCTDGAWPVSGLTQGADGNFYGTTGYGGTHNNHLCESSAGCGTIFKITPAGVLTTLYSFCAQTNCEDGLDPTSGLIQAADGNFYGTTWDSGGNQQAGTVYRITPGGKLTTIYSFCAQNNCADGEGPVGGLIQATDGYLYGTTIVGGAHGKGTIFKTTVTGALTTLYSFCAQTNCADGATSEAGLIQATDGNFYGTTFGGGADQVGTVFRFTPTGALTTLHSFLPGEGAQVEVPQPQGSLVEYTTGALYAPAALGGRLKSCYEGCGTVYSLGLGLSSFVDLLPAAGRIGEPVTILGTDLNGATGVTFNGTPATLVKVTRTAIQTTVPSGATTGSVQVVTPNGTLTSNVPFRVIP